jgi:manganese transport protein
LVAVGYMDPGNWATDLAGGSRFGYALLFVVVLSCIFAMVLQHLAIKLGVVTGQDLAQMCREAFGRPVGVMLWLMAEVMIIACDLAEVIGTAIALNLLFHIPLLVGTIITAADVLLLLFLQNKGFRYLEALVVTLIVTVLACFGLEIFFSHPQIVPLLQGLLPTTVIFSHTDMLYIAVGILGATVMPHNLYLHSAVVQTRDFGVSIAQKREAIKFATIDSTLALTLALFVNAAILIVAAATFFSSGHAEIAEIGDAYKLLTPLLGAGAASLLFAVALLASGQNSTLTGTLAGQVIMEGFIHLRLRPWIRRLITRGLAIIPVAVIIVFYGGSGLAKLLVLSQVILSIQLSFAVWPLVAFTGMKKYMGAFANRLGLKIVAGGIATIISTLNLWLIFESIRG